MCMIARNSVGGIRINRTEAEDLKHGWGIKCCQQTCHIIPLCSICDAVLEGLIHVFLTLRLPGFHDRVILCINQRQVSEETIIRGSAIGALAIMDRRVIKRITGHHGPTMQIPREHKSGTESEKSEMLYLTHLLHIGLIKYLYY